MLRLHHPRPAAARTTSGGRRPGRHQPGQG